MSSRYLEGTERNERNSYAIRGHFCNLRRVCYRLASVQLSSLQSLSRVRLFATPRIAARQASLSITNSWRSLRLTSIESVMPSSHLSLGHPLLLLPPISPSIRIFSNESTLRMTWPKYWLTHGLFLRMYFLLLI